MCATLSIEYIFEAFISCLDVYSVLLHIEHDFSIFSNTIEGNLVSLSRNSRVVCIVIILSASWRSLPGLAVYCPMIAKELPQIIS